MKVLHFGMLYFKLPDDFGGGLSEALRAFADYHDEKTGTPDQKIGAQLSPPDDVSADVYEERVWEEFLKMVDETDLRVHGTAGLSEYPDEGEGKHLDLNTGAPEEDANEVLSPEEPEPVDWTGASWIFTDGPLRGERVTISGCEDKPSGKMWIGETESGKHQEFADEMMTREMDPRTRLPKGTGHCA